MWTLANRTPELMTNNSPLVFVVFGPQGSGKSTQVERLAAKFGLNILEAGEVLRHRAKTDAHLLELVNSGTLVSDEVMTEIVEEEIEKFDHQRGVVFDGYPRDITQFNGFKMLADRYQWQVIAIFINLSDETAQARLKGRFQLVDGQKVTREDDQPAIVQKRLDTFRRETLPLKRLFNDAYQLIEIDGEPPIDAVTAEINLALTDA